TTPLFVQPGFCGIAELVVDDGQNQGEGEKAEAVDDRHGLPKDHFFHEGRLDGVDNHKAGVDDGGGDEHPYAQSGFVALSVILAQFYCGSVSHFVAPFRLFFFDDKGWMTPEDLAWPESRGPLEAFG